MGDFNWEIWFKKLGAKIVLVVAITILNLIASELEITEFPAEYTAIVALVVIILQQVANGIKHKWLVNS